MSVAHSSMRKQATGRSAEPALAGMEIQENVLLSAGCRYQELAFVRFASSTSGRSWLANVLPYLTSLATTVARRSAAPSSERQPYTGVGLTIDGLRALTADADAVMDVPLREGMARRSRLLGDPGNTEPGGPASWAVGAGDRHPDAVLIVGSDEPATVSRAVDRYLTGEIELVHREQCTQLGGADSPNEHFGFRDPISQPGVRGRLAGRPGGYLTMTHENAAFDEGAPGQRLVWPGEFVFGYPTQDAFDLHAPGRVARAGPVWTVNGSLMVVRRLGQDVVAFEQFAESTAARLRTVPELGGVTAAQVKAHVMGRWPDGTPIVRSAAPDIAIAEDPAEVNRFGYVGARGPGDDLHGLACPHAAHVRKAYPRDHETSTDTVESMETHRIIRRGISYDNSSSDRGLMFIAFQTSIERQFEFITRSWFNNPHLRPEGDGHDLIVGNNNRSASGCRERTFHWPYRKSDGTIDRVTLATESTWTTTTGGGYFFMPSITGLRKLIGLHADRSLG